MLYCSKCQLLTDGDTDRCPVCGSTKLRAPAPDDPVLLLTVDEMKVVLVRSVFQENGIVFIEQDNGFGSPPSMLLGRPFYGNRNIFVAYRDLPAAKELLNGIGFADADDAKLEKDQPAPEPVTESEEQSEPEEEPEPMSARKRFFWRIVSAMLFILVVWGVVAAADFVAGWLKALFT
ncbi:hypothetical protein [Caproiciproducens faecalis]|uniref:DUF2007 domain-containing protein n=1 Tax=Caproiciproducens faecalis TaxID=2820301 RepID=A0ABS7DMH3_9FIRM|nr:hypothetical protein [Caproiciproducens faecalis]MBW7572501.1 hypothetical protein [Caproiciproducens faecalis]